jgi:5'-nucleotidase
MNILVTNDDGIYSQGLKVLVDEASAFGEVYVAAPTEEKSD